MKPSKTAQEVLEQIGRNLHTIRNAKKLTLQTVEIETDISNAVLSRIENGPYPAITIPLLVQLVEFYKSSLSEVLQSDEHAVFHFAQNNAAGPNFQLNSPDNGKEAYQLYVDQLKSEIVYLRQQLSERLNK